MKLKYYLRGLGIGIICTAIIMGIALSGNKKEKLTDAEIIERARLLGMVMEEESSESDENNNEKNQSENNKIGEQKSENKILDQQNIMDNKTVKESENQTDKTDESENQTDKTDESENQIDKTDEPENQTDKTDELENTRNQATEKDSQDMVELEIKEGDFSDIVSKKLFEAGLIPDASEFNNYVTKKGVDDSLRICVYHIPIGSTADEIIEILQGKRK